LFLFLSAKLIIACSVVLWKKQSSRQLISVNDVAEKVSHSFTQLSGKKEHYAEVMEPQSHSITTEPFNNTNPNTEWCPIAVCHNSPLCAPCNRRYIIILAHGRSGSTTLLSMFNKLPGVRLSGENYGLLNQAAKLIFNLREHPDVFADDKAEVEGPFRHNAIPSGTMSCVVQDLMYTLDPPSLDYDGHQQTSSSVVDEDHNTIVGLKTIRLYNPNFWDVQKAVSFLKEAFPCARYIISKRSNLESAALSYQKAFQWNSPLEELEGYIERETQFLESVADELGTDIAQVVDVDDWKSNVGILNMLLIWLGFKGCGFDTILHDNRDQGYESDYSEVHLGDNCQAPSF